jgi:phosphatidylinositol glycan class Q protein
VPAQTTSIMANGHWMRAIVSSVAGVSYLARLANARLKQGQKALSKGQKSVGWFLAALTVDLALGMLLTAVLAERFPPQRQVEMLMVAMEAVVADLRVLIHWLMGAPAGLKLNSVLSGALGRFFLYHVRLWVTFLYLAAPAAASALAAAAGVLRHLGLCVQIAVAQDAVNLATFHVRCFYAYARRLHRSQVDGLLSLWRLFRGKKYNPLRQRVDSLDGADANRLFVGTVAFTILLFLYPTTLMYFVVFKVLELAIAGVNGLLSAAVHVLATLGGRVNP